MKDFYNNPLYIKSPVWAQNCFVTLKGFIYTAVRKNKVSLKLMSQLEKNERLDHEQIRALQLSKLHAIVKYAEKEIPWYQKVFKDAGFDASSKFTFDDYAALPILDKTTIQNNYDLFLPKGRATRFTIKSHSSGTTGNSLYIARDLNVIRGEWAFSQRQYRFAGIPLSGKMAYLRDDPIVPLQNKKEPFWRNASLSNELWLSSFHISKTTALSYIKALQQFRPQGIFAYPSTIYWLSVFAKEAGIDVVLPSLKGIVVSSEMLYDFQVKTIKDVFNVPVFDWYGSVERVTFIGTCEKGNRHLFPDYGYTEFIPSTNNQEQYDIIGTGFLNTAMPLLRYKSGDCAEVSNDICECGRNFPVINKMHGRNNDALVTSDGRRISVIDIFEEVLTVQQFQVVQESPSLLNINIVPKPGFCDSDRDILKKSMLQLVGNDMELQFNIIDRIPGGPQGKYRMIVSKLGASSPR